MIRISISSNVSNKNISVDLNDVLCVLPSFKFTLSNWRESLFWGEELLFIEQATIDLIKELEKKRVFDNSRLVPYVELNYGGDIWKLNYRNETDFKIGIFISLFNLTRRAIDCNGFLILFNRTFLDGMIDGNVFAILKEGRGVSAVDIYNEVLGLAKNNRIVSPISADSIGHSIEKLLDWGFIDRGEEVGSYKITAKGYMLQM